MIHNLGQFCGKFNLERIVVGSHSSSDACIFEGFSNLYVFRRNCFEVFEAHTPVNDFMKLGFGYKSSYETEQFPVIEQLYRSTYDGS